MDEADDPILAKLAEVVSDRGYLVIASARPHEIGDTVLEWVSKKDKTRTKHPLKVIAVTDAADFRVQAQAVYGYNTPPTGYPHFYRCTTD